MTRRLGRALRAGIAITVVLVATGLTGIVPASADLNGGTVGWQYSEAGNGFYQAPHTAPPDGGDPVRYREWGTIGTYTCTAPRAGCGATTSIYCGYGGLPPNGPPEYGYGEWTYARANAADEAKWNLVAIDCVATPEWVPIQDVGYDFQYAIERRLHPPVIELRPRPQTLVNLPTIVSTDYPTEKTFTITVPPSADRTIPLTGSINAHAEMTWTFEDGTTAAGAGRPYDGTDPTTHPDHYLTNTFQTAGHHTVTLTVTWTGTITVDTLAPEPFDPVTLTATAGVDVLESHPVLKAP